MIDVVAAEIHNIWIGWANKIMEEENISEARKKRWNKCFVPFNKLSKEMKDADRKIARKILRRIFT